MNNELEIRFEAGFTKPTTSLSLEDKQDLIRAIWLQFVYFIPHAELEQLKKGFQETLKMGDLVREYPESVFHFLVPNSDYEVSADFFLNEFSIDFSVKGSNRRGDEEAVMVNWTDYILHCNGDPVALSDVLQFLTGSSKLPAAGFPTTPSIHFADVHRTMPRVSTCDLSITFPLEFGDLTFEKFREKMDLCVLGSFGFGQP